MEGAESFVGALMEILQAYEIVTAKLVRRIEKLEKIVSESNVPVSTTDKTGSDLRLGRLMERVDRVEASINKANTDYEKRLSDLSSTEDIKDGELARKIELVEKRVSEVDSNLQDVRLKGNVKPGPEKATSETSDIDTMERNFILNEVKQLKERVSEIDTLDINNRIKGLEKGVKKPVTGTVEKEAIDLDVNELKDKLSSLEASLKKSKKDYENTFNDLLETRNAQDAELNKKFRLVEKRVSEIDSSQSVNELTDRISSIEARIHKIRVPSTEEIGSSLHTSELTDRIDSLEEKLSKIKVPSTEELSSSLHTNELTDRIGSLEEKINKIRVPTTEELSSSLHTSEVKEKVDALETLVEARKKNYDNKLEEVYTLRDDVDIVSRELIEVKNAVKELARMMSKSEVRV